MTHAQITLVVWLVAVLATAGTTMGRDEKPSLHVVVHLTDGSRIVGETMLTSVPVKSSVLGQLLVPLEQVRAIKFKNDHETATLSLANADKLEGVVGLASLKLSTSFGVVTIPRQVIVEMQIAGRNGNAPTEGLVLHFAFDDENPDLLTDDSPSNLQGEIHGAQLVPEGRFGGALKFNGGNDYVVVRRALPLDRLDREVTLAIWIKIDPATQYDNADSNPHIICKGATYANLYADFGISLWTPGGAITWEQSNFRNRPEYTRAESGGFPRGEWHHVAATFQEGTVKLYIDGRLDTTHMAPSKTLRSSDQPLYIGYRYVNPPTGAFRGLLDDLRVYSRALNDAEIQSLVSAAKPNR